jgi:putative flippase GtrA
VWDIFKKYPVAAQILRFVAIGFLNTALDFIILNLVTKTLGISSGLKLGSINVIGFSAAVMQSYVWNRYWAFSTNPKDAQFARNVIRLILVGGLGAAAMVVVLAGVHFSVGPIFYLPVLVVFLMAELVLWYLFGLHLSKPSGSSSRQFTAFLIVSIIGLLINSILIAVFSHIFSHGALAGMNSDSIKNIAKILATVASLVWNFIGYKVAVFK